MKSHGWEFEFSVYKKCPWRREQQYQRWQDQWRHRGVGGGGGGGGGSGLVFVRKEGEGQ